MTLAPLPGKRERAEGLHPALSDAQDDPCVSKRACRGEVSPDSVLTCFTSLADRRTDPQPVAMSSTSSKPVARILLGQIPSRSEIDGFFARCDAQVGAGSRGRRRPCVRKIAASSMRG